MIPDGVIEVACAAYYNSGILPIQYPWSKLVELGDNRVPIMRAKMRDAIVTLANAGLANAGLVNLAENDHAPAPESVAEAGAEQMGLGL